MHSVHGPDHWARVKRFGLALARVNGADPMVVELFALFHDSRRLNEYDDEGHGARGAAYAATLRGTEFDLSDAQFAQLKEACELHTMGQVSEDLTIGTCWDADRLDLTRINKIPDPKFMSTALVREFLEGKEFQVATLPRQSPDGETFKPSILQIFTGVEAADDAAFLQTLKSVKTMVEELETFIPELLKWKTFREYFKNTHPSKVQKFVSNFYSSYKDGSGILSNTFGSAKVLDVFRRLKSQRKYFQDDDDVISFNRISRAPTIFRGGRRPPSELALGFSWSTDEGIARKYADGVEGGIVIRASIKKNAILAAYAFEDEVIVDPKRVEDFIVVDTNDEPANS